MRRFLVVLVMLPLSGCITSETVYLKNANGQMAQCGPFTTYGLILGPILNRDKINDCVADYHRQGYERTPEPKSN